MSSASDRLLQYLLERKAFQQFQSTKDPYLVLWSVRKAWVQILAALVAAETGIRGLEQKQKIASIIGGVLTIFLDEYSNRVCPQIHLEEGSKGALRDDRKDIRK